MSGSRRDTGSRSGCGYPTYGNGTGFDGVPSYSVPGDPTMDRIVKRETKRAKQARKARQARRSPSPVPWRPWATPDERYEERYPSDPKEQGSRSGRDWTWGSGCDFGSPPRSGGSGHVSGSGSKTATSRHAGQRCVTPEPAFQPRDAPLFESQDGWQPDYAPLFPPEHHSARMPASGKGTCGSGHATSGGASASRPGSGTSSYDACGLGIFLPDR